MPTPRQEMPTASSGSSVHVLGGISATRTTLATHEVFDTATGEWHTAAPMPIGLHHHSAVAHNGSLYVAGGYSTLSFSETDVFYRYDTQTDTWHDLGPLPRKMGAHASAILGDYLYLVGGTLFNGAFNGAIRYDLQAGEWGTLPTMPSYSEHLAAAAVDGKLYVVGGRRRVGLPLINSSILMVYDPTSDTWEEGPDMPTARSGLAAVAFEGSLLTFGGEGFDDGPQIFGQVERYSPGRDTWDSLEPMPVPVHGMGAAAVDGRVYIMGGGDVAGFATTTTAAVFYPPAATGREGAPELPLEIPGLTVFPNPSPTGNLFVEFDAPAPRAMRLTAYDMLGRKMLSRTVESNATRIEILVSFLPRGSYILRLEDGLSHRSTPFTKR